MKKTKSILFILFLLIIYTYIASIFLLPKHIVLFEGEALKINTLFGVKVKTINSSNIQIDSKDVLETAATLVESDINKIGKVNLSLNLFNKIPIKQIEVDVVKKTNVIPLGNAIGLKLYTKGVMVVGMSEIENENEKGVKPYEGSNLKEGDMIIEVNNKKINNTDELIEKVNEAKGKEIELKYVRDEKTMQTVVRPVKTSNEEYKLGIWVRDAAARCRNSNIL